MYKGMYVAMTGAILRSQELDVTANNLANVNTAGYKRTSFSSRLYNMMEDLDRTQDAVYPTARSMTYFNKYQIDTSPGSIKTTGNPMDLAVNGEGFMQVEKGGQKFFTRSGNFTRDREGFMVTHNGYKVLDTTGKPLNMGAEGPVNIAADGTVYVNGANVGRLALKKVDEALHATDSLFTGTDAGPAKGDIVQGSIEQSNVNPIREMIGIMLALRQYDSANKVIQNFDDMARRTPEIVRG